MWPGEHAKSQRRPPLARFLFEIDEGARLLSTRLSREPINDIESRKQINFERCLLRSNRQR
jgi:hypothetical protein